MLQRILNIFQLKRIKLSQYLEIEFLKYRSTRLETSISVEI